MGLENGLKTRFLKIAHFMGVFAVFLYKKPFFNGFLYKKQRKDRPIPAKTAYFFIFSHSEKIKKFINYFKLDF